MRNEDLRMKNSAATGGVRKFICVILFFTLLFSLFTLTSCSFEKYLSEGESLLYKTEQTVAMADSSDVTPEVKAALKKSENYYLQRPNSKFLGIQGMPVGMWFYCVASPTDSSFWGRYWRNMGQEPVIYDEEKARRTAQQLHNLLESKGCFNSTVTFDTTELEDRKISITYRIKATQRYIIDDIYYHCDNNTIRHLLQKWSEESPLKAGAPYDQDNISSERSRLLNNLHEEGYYHATLEDITFVVDTTYRRHRLSIDVHVDGSKLQVYHINNIYVYPNSTAGLRSGESTYDTLIYNYSGVRQAFDYQFIYDKPMTIKPLTISRSLMLFPGMTYRPRYITNTYNSLLNLRNFKYINVEFSESPFSTDSLPLVDAHVRLINTTQRALSLSLEITNASPIVGNSDGGNFFSSGNLGLETGLEYQNKNLFGGAELFKVRGTLLFELPKLIFSGNSSGGFYNNFNAFEVGLDASLDMPEFLMPFSSLIPWQRTRPHTLMSLGGGYQYRYYFERIVANTSFGYSWTQRIGTGLNSKTAQHQLIPIDLTFVRILNLDTTYLLRIVTAENVIRTLYQYTDHFIMDARYDFSYSDQQFGLRRNFSVYHFSAESAGNLLHLWSHIVDGNVDSNGVREFFGVPFSQYVRFTGEFTRYHYHGHRNTFVTRLILGIGIPYGNSQDMPYEKSFYGGGPTTMRAWPLRHLGPGGYVANRSFDYERFGDLQLVLNFEERFPIAGIFEGALFADLGNIWLVNPNDDLYPDGEFKWDSFFKEIAVGIGLGLRVNVSVATLRLDFAIPLYDPGFDISERWRPPHWKFSQIVTNFGINYPF